MKQVIVFIHGAWQSSLAFNGVMALCRSKGLQCYALDLPGHGNNLMDFSHISLTTYIDDVVHFLVSHHLIDNVVLVGHSMSGMVISAVAERMKIAHCVYIAGFLPQSGDSLLSLAERFSGKGLSEFMQFDLKGCRIHLKKQDVEKVLYNGCDPRGIERALRQLQDQPALPFNGVVTLGQQFAITPKTYIVCLQDKIILPEDQRRMCATASLCRAVEIPAGHAAMLSHPEAILDVL